MKTLKDINNLRGKKVLLRLDFNVPIVSGRVLSDFRLRKSFKTLEFLIKSKSKIIILSHIGRENTDSLKPISNYLKDKIPHTFIENIYSSDTKRIVDKMDDGEVLLFENLRKYDGEKNNDEIFTNFLASFGDIFINDAFSVSHREHASIVGLPKKIPSYLGIQFEDEVNNLRKAFDPEHPFLLIIGGAKFETKLPIINKFIKKADNIFICGALANDIYKYKGYETGSSLTSNISNEILRPIVSSSKILYPKDVIVLGNSKKELKRSDSLELNDRIVDAGKESVNDLRTIIKKSKLIIWNGPFGLYEKGFDFATKEIAKLISKSKANTIVGGGDTLAVVEELNLTNKYSFVSTAGGAMLDFLENGSIVGLDAIE